LPDTPDRVAHGFGEIVRGLRERPEDVLTTTFDLSHDELVLVTDIEVYSACEHHLVPFHGVAHVGYIPGPQGRIAGLSTIARLVDVYAERPQVQARLTTQIADAMQRVLQPQGVIVVVECEHLCRSGWSRTRSACWSSSGCAPTAPRSWSPWPTGSAPT
jgi:GTP cyclohydrolase I